ncbi:hypothetical protein LN650_06915 [Klebsiella pneumoniae subsp. pneumoniae]|nr:hypothetical protein [Klebsiella pneumoniae subsp. pneumoniae]
MPLIGRRLGGLRPVDYSAREPPCWPRCLCWIITASLTASTELRLMVALDVGGAIKGQHFDIYQGIGPDAGHRAGWYNHYGRVWVLKNAPGAGNVFSG